MSHPCRVVVVGVFLVLGMTRAGHADDKRPTAEIETMMKTQAAAMVANDTPALVATLAKDGFITDTQRPSAGSTIIPSSISMPPAKIAFGAKTIGWRGNWGWVVADAKIGFYPHPEGMDPNKPTSAQMPAPVVQRWVALIVREGGELKTRALIITHTVPDSHLSGINDEAKKTVAKSPSPLSLLLAQPTKLAKQLAKDPAVAVVGTSPRDRAIGQTAAKKLLASWAKLDFQVPSSTDASDAPFELTVGDVHLAWAHLRMRKNIPLVGVVIARVTGDTTEVLVAGYTYPDGD